MPAHIARPSTVLAPHKITTDEIAEDIRTHHPDHPRLGAILRVIRNCGVDTRYFTQPLDTPTVNGTADIGARVTRAFADGLDMAEQAARDVLHRHGLQPGDITGLVTTHATGWAVPNLDIHLIARLGLRPTVRRTALTTIACAGGAHALIRAAEQALLHPGSRVLVVAAEVLSTAYNHADSEIEHMIYKALFGDSGAATLVSSEPLGPGLTVDTDGVFEYALPDSLTMYAGRIDSTGLHFDSTKQATGGARHVMPAVLDWLAGRPVDVPVIHPGSKPIILDTATALGLTETDARHSLDTLAEEGNLGGVSVLRVLERTHGLPPADGESALMVAYGPGFSVSALHGTWRN
ncbi:PhlD [Streptomyces cinerochromogenes]|uniref:PhlD n=1 Tax=Streptomyces cinerochromogenes TaxID=66422 RepID=UPI0016716B1E|nr:PhlD [Streptomyces cinerochromogenes]GGS54580.1 alpha-pyrone synthesis polyketide synthase-like Pks11 [Streptomyces cinerochromogenes]